jgi:hypothetical protein
MKRETVVKAVAPVDAISEYIFKGCLETTSFSNAIRTVMNMKASPVRKLLKALVKEEIELPNDIMTTRLATAWLVQEEMKFRRDSEFTSSLLPYHPADYANALEYANEKRPLYAATEEETEEGEETPKKSKKGKKGGVFDKVHAYLADHAEMLEKGYKAADAANRVAEEVGIPLNTALVYLYKCRKMNKRGE